MTDRTISVVIRKHIRNYCSYQCLSTTRQNCIHASNWRNQQQQVAEEEHMAASHTDSNLLLISLGHS